MSRAPTVMLYAEMIQLSWLLLTAKSSRIEGKATLTAEMSITTKNTTIVDTLSASHARLGMASSAAGAGAVTSDLWSAHAQ